MRADGLQKRAELKRKAEQILERRGGKPSYMMIDPAYVIDLVNGFDRLLKRLGSDERDLFEENAPRKTRRKR